MKTNIKMLKVQIHRLQTLIVVATKEQDEVNRNLKDKIARLQAQIHVIASNTKTPLI